MHGGNIAIVGASETTELGVIPNMSSQDLHVNAALNAIADSGLTLADIDGVANDSFPPYEVSDLLGIRPRWVDGTGVGGCSYMLLVRHAAAAIAAGEASVVLISHGESGRSRVGSAPYSLDGASLSGQFEAPFGALAPYSTFTLPVLAFLESRGMSRRDLAEVVSAQRTWAARNPRALKKTPVTVEEVLAEPTIAYPFSKDMCCVVTDGGGALVLVSAARARDAFGLARGVPPRVW